MKLFLMLLGMAAAGVLGYLAEPMLRPTLVGSRTPVKQVSEATPTAEEGAERVPSIDPATLAPEQLPAVVKITRDAKLKDLTPGMTVTIDAGTELKLVRVEGANAILRPGEQQYTFPFPVKETDLLERLAADPPKPVVPAEETAPEPAPVEEPAPVPAPVVEDTPPEPAGADEPAPMPGGESEEPAPMPEPPVAENRPETEPMPEPAPAPGAGLEPAPAGNDVVAIMKKSIGDGAVQEFTLDQVTDWQAGGVETIDGSSYQTGTLTYKAETIFGVRTIQAKALIHNGEVVRWIWPKSGMEIR